jgi:hypothetical protein
MPHAPLTQAGVFTYDAMAALNSLLSSLGIVTQGNVYWVRPFNGLGAGAGGDGKSPATAFRTLTEALAAATAGQNDVVLLCAESNTAAKTTNYLSANLDWNKDGVHLIGLNNGGILSSRSRVATLASAVSFANLFTVSANNCLISGIEFYQGAGSNTLSAAQTAVTVTGMRNRFVKCMISGMGDTTLDYAGSNSLTLSGAENVFEDCYIGLDTIIRATSVTEVILSGAAPRNIFKRCHFRTYTSGTTFKLITIPTTADRFQLFENCYFTAAQNLTSSAIPTGVFGITTCNGTVLVNNPYVYGPAQIVTADNAYVQVLGQNGLATGHLIGIAQGVDAA